MGFVDIFLLALGLSMDAFAAAVCKGFAMPRLRTEQVVIIGAFFGGFQMIMPLIGFFLGAQFESFVAPLDHWLAVTLLTFVGGRMLIEALRNNGRSCEEQQKAFTLDIREMTMLAIATSIDALAVGITLAFLGVDIISASAQIGLVTFMLSVLGVVAGHQFGSRCEKPASIIGGVVLIIIGVKILCEHLSILSF